MKKRFAVSAILLAALAVLAAPRPAEGSVAVSISFFHERLSPHGRWVVAGSYGDCWVPAGVAAGWAPYVDGQWYWTDYGWTWASLDPWGDLPFHYGTWVWADPYGWVWVPGTVWAPAWVTWAYTDAYIGWAPLPPSFVLAAGGYYGGPVVVSQRSYCFVPTRSFVGVNVASVRQAPGQNATILASATRSTRFTVSGGVVHVADPPPSRIERATGHRIERVSVARASTQPTTISAGGLARASRIAVAAPADERARVLHASARMPSKPDRAAASTRAAGAEPRHETHPPASVAEKPRHETHVSVSPAEKPRHEEAKPAHEQKTASTAESKRSTAHPAAPAQHRPETQVAHGSHERSVAPPPRTHEAAPRPAAKEAAPARESAPAGQAAKPQAAASHGQAPRPPAQKAPPPPKPKPPEKDKDKEHHQGA
jgi:hypothetical protein